MVVPRGADQLARDQAGEHPAEPGGAAGDVVGADDGDRAEPADGPLGERSLEQRAGGRARERLDARAHARARPLAVDVGAVGPGRPEPDAGAPAQRARDVRLAAARGDPVRRRRRARLRRARRARRADAVGRARSQPERARLEQSRRPDRQVVSDRTGSGNQVATRDQVEPASGRAPGDGTTVDGSGAGSGGPTKAGATDPDEARDPQDPTADPALKTKAGTPNGTTTKKPPVKTPPKKLAAADEKDPKALLKHGQALEKAGEWEQARLVYQKLEKIKGTRGPPCTSRRGPRSRRTTPMTRSGSRRKAANLPGAQKTDAMFLYGDALFRQGEFTRAKDVFLGLYRRLQGDAKATAQRKVAACNRNLKLPESDGLAAR